MYQQMHFMFYTYTHTYTHTYIHTYIHSYIQVCMYTKTSPPLMNTQGIFDWEFSGNTKVGAATSTFTFRREVSKYKYFLIKRATCCL